MLLLRGSGHHGQNHHHHAGKHHHHHHGGACAKSSAKERAANGHHGCAKGGCGSEKITCEPRKECSSDGCVTKQSKTERSCCSEDKSECCVEASATHVAKDCCGEKDAGRDENGCCGEVDECCAERGVSELSSHHHHLDDETQHSKCDARNCSVPETSANLEENSSKANEESIIVVEDEKHKPKSSSHIHGISCSSKSQHHAHSKPPENATKASHCHKAHCETSKQPVMPSCKSHEATHSKTTNCCTNKNSQPGHKQSEISSVQLSESSPRHACGSLGKREMGGCCKSYRKECCSHKHRPFGAGLSEIVIE